MKIIYLFVLTIVGYLFVLTPISSSAQIKHGTYIRVQSKLPSSVLFNYYGKNYRHTTFEISNKKNSDTIIVQHIEIDKPTVFTVGVIQEHKLMQYSFIGFNTGDTISLEVTGPTTLAYTGNDKKMIFFNKVFGFSTMAAIVKKPYTIEEYETIKTSAVNEKNERLKLLTDLVKENKMDSSSIQFFKDYFELVYYRNILEVDYQNSKLQVWKHPDIVHLDSLDCHNRLLLSINSSEVRVILSQLINYNAYLNNRFDKTIFENIPLLNSRFYKTKMLDGFIFDRLEDIPKLEKRGQILASLKNYILDDSNDKITLSKEIIMSKEALNVKLKGYDGNTMSFDQLLKSNQKIIVLDFWASWCVPCIDEIPKYKNVSSRLSNKIKFISISSDTDQKKWMDGCNKFNVKTNSFLLSNISSNNLLKFFGITSYPTFVVITNKGEVLSNKFFRPSHAQFEVELEKMLESL